MKTTTKIALAVGSSLLLTGLTWWLLTAREPSAGAGNGGGELARAAGRIVGFVLGPQEKPVEGARVVAYPECGGRPLPLALGSRRDAEPDRGALRSTLNAADGSFALEAIATAASVAVEAQGYSPAFAAHAVPGERCVVRLERSRRIVGIVANRLGAPIPGARVEWSAVILGARVERAAVAGADGAYALEEIPSARAISRYGSDFLVWIRAEAEGFVPARFERPRLALNGDGVETFHIALARGATIRGRVVDDETGAPLAGVSVVGVAPDGIQILSPAGQGFIPVSDVSNLEHVEAAFCWGPTRCRSRRSPRSGAPCPMPTDPSH